MARRPRGPDGENKPGCEPLESVSGRAGVSFLRGPVVAHCCYRRFCCVSFRPQDDERLQETNGTLLRKLKEAEREVEILKTLLKRHALHHVEEDSSS